MTNLDSVACGDFEHDARAQRLRNERAHQLTGLDVTLDACHPKRFSEARFVSLDAQLENARARPLERGDRPLRCHCSLVEHDDVVAGELDVGQQV